MNKNTYHKTNNSNANGNGIIMNEYNEYWTQANISGSNKGNMSKNGENNINKAENQMYQINKPRPSLNNNGINDNDGEMER